MTGSIVLKTLDLFKWIFRLFNVDYVVMRNILAVKLTMDQRRVPTIFQDTKQREKGNTFLKSLLLYALYGLILIPFILMGENYMFQMSTVFGIMMFILMTSMISDFSSVLLDVRDKSILHTKPVNARTITAAKMIHVIIYMVQLTGAFVLIPFIVAIGVKGLVFSIIFFVEIILIVFFIIVLTALIYIFILRFFDGERLKDLINYVQIFLSISIFVGYQVLVRSFEFVDLSINFDWYWWHVFIPPMWFAAPFEWLLLDNQSTYIISFSLMAVVIPVLSLLLYLRLVPSFEQNLQKLLNTTAKTKPKKDYWERWMAQLCCSTNEERALFRFANKMLGQEREFKLKVYPALGFSIIMPFVILFNVIRADFNAPYAFLAIYLCNLMIPNVIHMLKYSSKYQGAWIYGTLPITKPKAIYRATLKAFIAKLYMPIILVISLIFLFVFSLSLILDIVAIILVGWLYVLSCYKLINNQRYPFSQSFSFAQNVDTGNMILSMFIIGGFAIAHYIVSLIPFGISIYIIVLAIGNWIAWKKVFS